MLGVEETKAIVLVLMLVLTLGAGLIPLYIYKRMTQNLNQAALSVCLCFGAGVLLSIVFLHLLPETEENFTYAMEEGFIKETHYPLAQVAILSGFFLVYLMEEVIHAWVDHKTGGVQEVQVTQEGPATVEEAQRAARARRTSLKNEISEMRLSTSSRSTVLGVAVIKEVKGYLNGSFESEEAAAADEKDGEGSSSGHIHHRDEPVAEGLSLAGTLMVIAALSFHSVMEGLSIGLENKQQDIWMLFAALVCHKVIIAFSMSMELLQAGMKTRPFLLAVFIFAAASPLGGLIGALVTGLATEDSAAGILATTMLQAVSGGTILYVTFCEVLQRERTKPMNGFLKFVGLLLGFGLMAVMEAVAGHEHGHEHGNDQETTMSSSPPTSVPT